MALSKEKAAEIQVVLGIMKKQIVIQPRPTHQPVIIGMVGLTMPNRPFVAERIANLAGAIMVKADDIRLLIRQRNKSRGEGHPSNLEYHEALPKILESLRKWVITKGGDLLVDSDHYEAEKRNQLEKFAQEVGAKVIYIRVVCDQKVIWGRVLGMEFSEGHIFKNAETAIRETVRRLGFHYYFEPNPWGQLILKPDLGFEIFATIDTTDQEGLERNVGLLVEKII